VAVTGAAGEAMMFGPSGAGWAVFVFLSVGAVALFSFVAVASWADARRKEREAYYRSETLKKIAESQGGGAVLDLLREERTHAATSRREGLKLGGLVNLAVGLGLMAFLAKIAREVYLVGLIPLLIGAALLGYAVFLSPRE
jgi:hypothetical protein